MDAFGWNTQDAADPFLRNLPSDDGLLGVFMSFHDGHHRSDHGSLDLSSLHSIPNQVHCHDGVPFMGLHTEAPVLPTGVTGASVDDGLFDSFAYVPDVVAVEGVSPQTTVSNSNTVFSGYGSTTGGNGNVSSGESNTCGGGGGHDIEVASSPCAVPTASKRKLDKRPAASCAQATMKMAAAEQHERRGAKRAAAATSSSSTSITFGGPSRHHHQVAVAGSGGTFSPLGGGGYEPDAEAMAQVKEMIYRAAAMRPVHQLVRAEPPSSRGKLPSRRKNVRISSDPQTVAARLRRERVSERLRVLQRLVPGGARMDTASMLDEAASYLKFLKSQLVALESGGGNPSNGGGGGYCNGSLLLQNYTGNDLGGGGGSAVLAFGSRDAIGGYVKPNKNITPL